MRVRGKGDGKVDMEGVEGGGKGEEGEGGDGKKTSTLKGVA